MRTPMLPGPSTITLDQESFKALASEVRVDILKKLDERRQTVTDLSALLNLSKPTLLEHLEKLQVAGLVKRVDEGRKWIYYELSQKGRKLLHPEKVAIVLALSSAGVLAAIGAFFAILVAGGGLIAGPAYRGTPGVPAAGQMSQGTFLGLPSPYGPVALIAFLLAAAAAAIALVFYWVGRRRRRQFFSELAAS